MTRRSTEFDNSIRRFPALKLGMGGASLGRPVSLAVLLGITLFAGVVFTAQAQSADREIADLTLRSNATGTLIIDWDEPDSAPYGYRGELGQEQRELPFVA